MVLGVGEGDKNDTRAIKRAHSKLGYDWRRALRISIRENLRSNRCVNFTHRFFTEHINESLATFAAQCSTDRRNPLHWSFIPLSLTQCHWYGFSMLESWALKSERKFYAPLFYWTHRANVFFWCAPAAHALKGNKKYPTENLKNSKARKHVPSEVGAPSIETLLLQQSCCSYKACTSINPASVKETELPAKFGS